MPPTVIVNKMTGVHSKSNGLGIAFPDVCKTPIPPAGPVPIPYPNIGMSSDASDEVKKVKFDKGKLMGKGSKLKMSSGDEPGTAQGLVSNKIKGKAEFILYSFNVKAGGKNVCRLLDPMKQNMGSSPNGASAAVFQPPNVAMDALQQFCDRVNRKPGVQEEKKKANWDQAGVAEAHRSAFEEVAKDREILILVRWSNQECTKKKWIQRGHRPKPHAVFFAGTIAGREKLGWARDWYDRTEERLIDRRTSLRALLNAGASLSFAWVAGALESGTLYRIQGVIGANKAGVYHGMPLKAHRTRGGVVDDMGLTKDYSRKWITGDYDLYDIMAAFKDCEQVAQKSDAFKQIQNELNAKMKWHGIQHGPQVQWCPRKAAGDASDAEDFPDAVNEMLGQAKGAPGWNMKQPDGKMRSISVGGRNIPVMAGEIVAVFPGGNKSLEKPRDVADALLCKGCAE